jgi:hypothetical protein
MVRWVSSPLNLRSCGMRPIDCERKDLGLVADVRIPVHHGRRADAASAAKPNVLAHHGVRTDDRPGPYLRAFHDDRGRVDPDAIGHDGEQQVHLGHDLVADKRHDRAFSPSSVRAFSSVTSSRS